MNKKFSTLMAGLMLASAFSVSAQKATEEYKDGKYYLLGTTSGTVIDKVLSVESDAKSTTSKYGELSLQNAPNDLAATREALWKVTVIQEKLGDTPTYRFVNVATGQYLSVEIPEDANDKIGDNEKVIITGKLMEWYNGLNSTGIKQGNKIMSYIDKNEVVYLATDNNKLVVKRGKPNNLSNAILIQPYRAKVVSLNANELNKELIMNNDDVEKPTFTLSFNKDCNSNSSAICSSVPSTPTASRSLAFSSFST